MDFKKEMGAMEREREKEFQKVLFSDEIHIAAPKRNEGRGFTPRPVRSPASAGFP